MSLNRCEQRIFDYLERHPEEREFWRTKVKKAAAAGELTAAAASLARELWRYYEERSAVAAPFKEVARREGLQRTSMQNLAELLLRLWTEPRPKKRPDNDKADLTPF